jgi:hypothetical protein
MCHLPLNQRKQFAPCGRGMQLPLRRCCGRWVSSLLNNGNLSVHFGVIIYHYKCRVGEVINRLTIYLPMKYAGLSKLFLLNEMEKF